MASIRVGTIGLGSIGQGVHLPGIDHSPDLKLSAICDIDKEKLKMVGERYGIGADRRFADYRELIACADVEAVDIATPNNCHFQMAMDAAQARKPFLLEKPVTMNAGEAERLARRARESGVKNMVCFSYRYVKAARKAREIVAQGLLGELYHANVVYAQSWGLKHAGTPLVWRFDKDVAGLGALGDLGCHMLDMVRFVTQREYVRLMGDAFTYIDERPLPGGDGMGKVGVDDCCNYLARMQGGFSANFHITRFAYGRGDFQRLELFGSQGSLIYMLNPGPNIAPLSVCIGQPMGNMGVFSPLPVAGLYEGDEQMQSFADLINDCSDGLYATMEDGLLNQKAVDAVKDSIASGRWMEV